MTAFIDMAEKNARDEIRKGDWNALTDDAAHLYESGLFTAGNSDQVGSNYPIGSYAKLWSISFTLAQAAHIIFNAHSTVVHSSGANNTKVYGYLTLDGVRLHTGDGFVFHHTGNNRDSVGIVEFIPDVAAGLHILEVFGSSTVDNDVTSTPDYGANNAVPHWDIMEIRI